MSRRYVAAALSVPAVVLGLWAAWNVWVDPYGAWRAAGVPTSGLPERTWSRVAAAERMLRPECDVVLLGTSQVVFGYGVAPFERGGQTWCNGAIGAGSMAEMVHAARLLTTDGRAREVVLFLDLIMFHDGRGLLEDFNRSRLNPDQSMLTYRLYTALGWDTFVQAAHTRGARAWWIPPDNARPEPYIATHIQIKGFLKNPHLFRSFTGPDRSFEALDATLGLLDAAGIDVTVVLPAIHAIHEENMRVAGLWTASDAWRVRLADVLDARGIEAWDFHGYHAPATAPLPFRRDATTNPYWIDSVHPSEAMGRAMLDRIDDLRADRDAGWAPGFGRALTPAAARAAPARRETDRAAWIAANPGQVRAYREALANTIAEDPSMVDDWARVALAQGQTAAGLDTLTPLPPEGRPQRSRRVDRRRRNR